MHPVEVLALVALVNFLAAFVQASCGFGYALVAMALMPLFLPLSQCSAISAATIVVIGLQMTLSLRREIRLGTVVPPLCSCLLTINLGLYLLDRLDEMLLRIVLACTLVFVTILFFVMRRCKIELPKRWYSAVAAGLLTGLSTGMFNIVGPFLMIYYMSVCRNTLHLKASLEFSFLLAGLYSTGMHLFVYGNIVPSTLPALGASWAAALAAGVLGLRLYKRIDRDKIAIVVYILLPVMAVTLVRSGL